MNLNSPLLKALLEASSFEDFHKRYIDVITEKTQKVANRITLTNPMISSEDRIANYMAMRMIVKGMEEHLLDKVEIEFAEQLMSDFDIEYTTVSMPKKL